MNIKTNLSERIKNNLSFVTGCEEASFYTKDEYKDVFPEPIPAHKELPDWYESLNIHPKDESGNKMKNLTTAKGCMPLFEGMSVGWIIKLPVDIFIRKTPNGIEIDSRKDEFDFTTIKFHQEYEFGGLSNIPLENTTIAQFGTPWIIDVPKGYSVWQLPLLNRWEYDVFNNFHTFSGIYDADKRFNYLNQITFASLENIDELRLKSGMPLSQFVIINRDAFINEASIKSMNKSKELKLKKDINEKNKNPHRYKEKLWDPIKSTINRYVYSDKKNNTECPFHK